MVRAVKTVAPQTPAPVVADATKTTKAKKTTKAAVEVAPAVVVKETVAPVADASSTEAVTDASSLSNKMTEFGAKLQQLVGLFSTVKNDFKTLEKTVSREMKNAQKASSKKRRQNSNRAPSGFVKPTKISNELAAFLGKEVGSEMARTTVSKEINAYIRANNLQDKTNGRLIIPDNKLKKLLNVSDSDQLSYFNLQKFMKHHFIKSEPAASA